jgi:neogenin
MKTAYTIHGMDKFTEYLVRVEAEGENGAGISSDAIPVRTLSDVPSAAPRHVRVETASTTSVSSFILDQHDRGVL